MVGPNLSGRDCQSQQLMQQIMTGAKHGIPNVIFGLVDVRDVARAHITAMEKKEAKVRVVGGGRGRRRKVFGGRLIPLHYSVCPHALTCARPYSRAATLCRPRFSPSRRWGTR